jgi:hypothetical protein
MVEVPFINYQFACTQNCDIIQWLVWLGVIVVIVCLFSIAATLLRWMLKLFKRR